MEYKYPKNQTWTEEEAKIEKSLLFHDFVYDLIKYSLLAFIVPYITAFALSTVFIDKAEEFCKLIK